jgi:hypothetical protein
MTAQARLVFIQLDELTLAEGSPVRRAIEDEHEAFRPSQVIESASFACLVRQRNWGDGGTRCEAPGSWLTDCDRCGEQCDKERPTDVRLHEGCEQFTAWAVSCSGVPMPGTAHRSSIEILGMVYSRRYSCTTISPKEVLNLSDT